MNYETKQFKKTARNEQIDLKQELMGEQNQSIQQQLQVNINLSEPTKSRANTMSKAVSNTQANKYK